jgi:hypothetical protein
LQTLTGYNVETAGRALSASGLVTLVAMPIVGRQRLADSGLGTYETQREAYARVYRVVHDQAQTLAFIGSAQQDQDIPTGTSSSRTPC